MSREAFKANEVAQDVWRIESCLVNMYLVSGSRRAAVIDTGYGFSDLSDYVRTLTQKPVDVFLTHGHYDHAVGTRHFKAADIYMHPDDREVLVRHFQKEILKGAKVAARLQRILHPWSRIFDRPFSWNRYFDEVPPVTRPLSEGDAFDLGGVTLHVVELPGHTKGSVGFYIPERKLLIAGDAVNRNTYLQLPESTSLSTYIETIQKVMQLDIDLILEGHGAPEPKERLHDFLYVAEHLDYGSGRKEKNEPPFSKEEIRSCHNRERHAGLVISRDKL